MSEDKPLAYWMDLAIMRFEDDLFRLMNEQGLSRADLARSTGTSGANITQILNGKSKNPQLQTLVKLARAMDSYVQVRMMRDGREVLRVMDVEEAIRFDERQMARGFTEEAAGESYTYPLATQGARVLQFKHSPTVGEDSHGQASLDRAL